MPFKSKFSIGVALCMLMLCIGVGHFATAFSVDWALKREARSLGMDWALHIENRIPDLSSMRTPTGIVDSTMLPDPEEFHELLADVTTVGHIYQFDFINALCLCELSIGSHLVDPDNPTGAIDDHSDHDHAQPSFSAQPTANVTPNVLAHVLGNEGSHAQQKIPSGSGYQLPVERDFVRYIIDDQTSPTFIRRNFGSHQPSTFAEVYHPVLQDGEFLYLLRVLVDLETQANVYTNFFRLGAMIGLAMLALAFGYPAFLYLRSLRKQHDADKRAHVLAHYDLLTNLKNRNDFQETASDILWRCHENGKYALLFIMDLNSFKDVNDFHGHQVGDQLLCEFAATLRKYVPKGGYIARLGGDEFVVVLDNIPAKAAHYTDFLNMPKSIELRVPRSGEVVTVSIAGGVAQYPRDGETIGDLVQAADFALYAAKPNRSGEIQEYNVAMKRDFYDRVQTRDQFRLGLKNLEIEPYYQPIVDMRTGQVEAFEALARWNHPERGVLTPLSFDTVFNDPELCVQLGQQMLTKIVADMKEWKEAGIPFKSVGFNVLDSDLKSQNFAKNLSAMLDESGLKASELIIEVTENCFFNDDKEKLISVLEQLRDAGHPIALDDFGTGYSSIMQLKELPISTVKIDKSFIDDVISNPTDQSIIGALLNLGRSMDFKLVPEGIETVDQRDFLRQMGFVLAQGYFYSRPMPASHVPAYILQQRMGTDPVLTVASAG